MSRNSALRVMAFIAATIGFVGTLTAQSPPTAEFSKLDRIEDDWINRNPVPYRPMVAMPDLTIFAVNPYLSEVVHIQKDPAQFKFTIPASSNGTPKFTGRFRTLPGPVSIAHHTLADNSEELIVVCQHANAVAIHDAATGDLKATINLMNSLINQRGAGPGDIVVDQAQHRAWVSCPLGDKVVAIDLTARTILKYYDTSAFSRSPGFLCLYNGEVLVAPRISGNGSLVDRKDFPDGLGEDFDEHAGTRGIVNTLTLTGLGEQGLPDHDLLWLDSSTLGNPSGGVVPIAKSTGTILLGMAVRPTTPPTNVLWQLNLDANNKDDTRQSEGALRGQFVFNRLTKIQLPATLSATEVSPLESRYLDRATTTTSPPDMDHPEQYAATSAAIATPYSLAFNTNGSLCVVTGLMSDNVIFLTGAGNRFPNSSYELQEIAADTDTSLNPTNGDENTMPRQVLINGNNLLAVWGSNLTVHFVDISVTPTPAHYWLRVGFDPTPAKVQEGRKIFFDGSHSMHANASCASCHDEGKSDMLAWNLSNIDATAHDGNDNKGPMVTQTLLNISRAMPFHWRGEQRRGLADFNDGFKNLLGASAGLGGLTLGNSDALTITPDGEFDRFQAFVLSLTEDANQFESFNRKLDENVDIPIDALDEQPAPGTVIDAREGQQRFLETCAVCHMFPTFTNNEVVDNSFGGDPNPDRLWLKVAPFQGMQNKAKQKLVQVKFTPGTRLHSDTQIYPILGSGLSHAGVVRDSIPFMQVLLFDSATRSYKDRLDAASFVYQVDTGIAPAAERSVFYNSGSLTALTSSLDYFLGSDGQAKDIAGTAPRPRNCDLAVVGKLKSNDPTAPFFGWVYEPGQDKFFGPGPAGLGDGGRPLSYFSDRVAAGTGAWFMFIGLPVGNAWRFAADPDGDQLPNQLEIQAGLDMFKFDSTVPPDGVSDGAQVYNGGEAFIHTDLTDNLPGVISGPLNFQWVTQTTARLTFETDEMCKAKLTMTPNLGGPVITVAEDIFKMRHDLLVTGLIYPLTYTNAVELTDMGAPGVPNPPPVSVTPPPTLNMVTALANAQPPAPPRTDTAGIIRVKDLHSSTTFPKSTDGVNWEFQYEATVADKILHEKSNVWVAARVLVDGKPLPQAGVPLTTLDGQPATQFDVNGTPYTPTGFAFDITPGDGHPSTSPPPLVIPGVIPGPFVIGRNPSAPGFVPTTTDGRCNIHFKLDLTGKLVTTPQETKVTLCMEVMGTSLAQTGPNVVNMSGNGSFGIFTDQTTDHTGGGPAVPSLFCPPSTFPEFRSIDLWWTGSGWAPQDPTP